MVCFRPEKTPRNVEINHFTPVDTVKSFLLQCQRAPAVQEAWIQSGVSNRHTFTTPSIPPPPRNCWGSQGSKRLASGSCSLFLVRVVKKMIKCGFSPRNKITDDALLITTVLSAEHHFRLLIRPYIQVNFVR